MIAAHMPVKQFLLRHCAADTFAPHVNVALRGDNAAVSENLHQLEFAGTGLREPRGKRVPERIKHEVVGKYSRCICGHTALSHLFSGFPEMGGRCMIVGCGCAAFQPLMSIIQRSTGVVRPFLSRKQPLTLRPQVEEKRDYFGASFRERQRAHSVLGFTGADACKSVAVLYDANIGFSKTYTLFGPDPLIQHQNRGLFQRIVRHRQVSRLHIAGQDKLTLVFTWKGADSRAALNEPPFVGEEHGAAQGPKFTVDGGDTYGGRLMTSQVCQRLSRMAYDRHPTSPKRKRSRALFVHVAHSHFQERLVLQQSLRFFGVKGNRAPFLRVVLADVRQESRFHEVYEHRRLLDGANAEVFQRNVAPDFRFRQSGFVDVRLIGAALMANAAINEVIVVKPTALHQGHIRRRSLADEA